ncbi:conserved membrane hypothetical protein [uncultured delta proteobacterium]|uniref:Integral membrane protein n=1 Tax=uncultured delta proteobacterium TaxID=34034 RepID=A0A212JLD8_9DELT|nr:conserved membrane hypothetical protein [uncultured delta proteobacterium]
MLPYIPKAVRLFFGIFLMSLGSYMTVQGNIGLSPWTAFAMGLSLQTGASFGNMMIAVSVVIVIIDFALKEKIGFGTLINGVMIGVYIDIIAYTGLVPMMTGFWSGLAMLILSLFTLCLGSYFYIGAGLGCGPRDSLMVALCRRMAKTPIGVVRSLLEGTALTIGWLMGAKIGLGTVISVFCIGAILQATFTALRFDVKAVQHENMLDTIRIFQRACTVKQAGSSVRK